MKNDKLNLDELNEMISEKIDIMESDEYVPVPRVQKADYIACGIISFISLIVFYVTYALL